MNYKEYLDFVNNISNQIKEGYNLTKDFRMIVDINKIAFAGAGDSETVGRIMIDLYGDKEDMYIVNDYHIPKFFNSNTLLILISYSGEDEEIISLVKDGLRQNCRMIIITSGGKLEKLAIKDNIKLIRLPKDIPEPTSIYQTFFAVLRILVNLNIIDDPTPEVEGLINILRIKSNNKAAIELSEKILNKTPIIYSPKNLGSIAYRWKTQLNEISKIHCFYNTLPEINHNEILAYSFENPDNYVIFLTDEQMELKFKKIIKITKEIIKRSCETLEIQIKGKSKLAKIFTAINLGDLTSIHLAIERNINPLSFNIIEELNKRIKKDSLYF